MTSIKRYCGWTDGPNGRHLIPSRKRADAKFCGLACKNAAKNEELRRRAAEEADKDRAFGPFATK